MGILEQLYDGEIHPFESIAPKSEEYKKLLREKEAVFDTLNKTLNAEQRTLLEKFNALHLDIGSEFGKENFLTGVKLGAEFIIGIAYGDNRKCIEEK